MRAPQYMDSSCQWGVCRMGRWKDAVTANVRAYRADMEFTKHCMISYGPEHNTDMLIYAANMAGMVCTPAQAAPTWG